MIPWTAARDYAQVNGLDDEQFDLLIPILRKMESELEEWHQRKAEKGKSKGKGKHGGKGF